MITFFRAQEYLSQKRSAIARSVGLVAVGTFGSIGCAPVMGAPSAAIGIIGGVFAILSLVYLFSHSKVLARDLLIPPLWQRRTKAAQWLRVNGQELIFFVVIIGILLLFSMQSLAQVRIPGADESAKLKAAGTLLMLIDTALFVWLARIFAGLCVLSAGWLIKEQKFGPAVVCVLGALIIGTSPMWVRNIFEIGGGGGVFK